METGGFSMLIILQCPQSAQMENPLISCSCLKHQHTAIMLHALLLCRWLCLNHKAKSARRLVPSVLVYLLACFQLPVTEIPTQTGWNIKGHFYFLTQNLKRYVIGQDLGGIYLALRSCFSGILKAPPSPHMLALSLDWLSHQMIR